MHYGEEDKHSRGSQSYINFVVWVRFYNSVNQQN
jgi:hypothetical protein